MNIYKKVYEIIGNETPLDTDCGTLCNEACCKGGDNRGMLLYPGEEALYRPEGNGWYTVEDSSVRLADKSCIKIFTCNGTCERDMRPLACRIFPLMPYISEEGLLEFRLDLKGVTICPLILNQDRYPLRKEFIDVLYDAFELLITDERVVEFIELLSDDYDTMLNLLTQDREEGGGSNI